MNRLLASISIILSSSAMADTALTTQQQQLSYSYGQQLGILLKQQGAELDLEAVKLGLTDAIAGQSTRIPIEQMQKMLLAHKAEVEQKRQQQVLTQAQTNKQQGETFLAQNQTRPGVVTLPSGLQYEVLQQGTGDSPKPGSEIVAHYRGTLIDGTVFDSSYDRGEPLTFNLEGVIKGWTEALQLMKPGAKWKLFIPYGLGYGERGAGGKIDPYSTLIFDVELISFK